MESFVEPLEKCLEAQRTGLQARKKARIAREGYSPALHRKDDCVDGDSPSKTSKDVSASHISHIILTCSIQIAKAEVAKDDAEKDEELTRKLA